jgi:hypothetical protein
MKVIAFPKSAKRGRPRKPKASAPGAQVHIFSTARHVRIVKSIAKLMLTAAHRVTGPVHQQMDAAEAVLISHLEVEFDRGVAYGVAELEIENEVRAFAIAAWAEYVKRSPAYQAPGAA